MQTTTLNEHNIKVSYCCLDNIASTIARHNRKNTHTTTQPNPQQPTCNCRNPPACPLGGSCLSKAVVYRATVTPPDGIQRNYTGLTANDFKGRYTQHLHSFRSRDRANSTSLSRFIWRLSDQGHDNPTIEWRIIKTYGYLTWGGDFMCITSMHCTT